MSIDPLISEIRKKLLEPIILLFRIPLVFIRDPFRFYQYVSRGESLGEAVSIYIDVALIQVFFGSLIWSRLSSDLGIDSSADNAMIQTMNSPIVSNIFLPLWDMVIVVGSALPACNYLTSPSSQHLYLKSLTTVMFFAVFTKIVEAFQASPILIMFVLHHLSNLSEVTQYLKYTLVTAWIGLPLGLFLCSALVINIKKLSEDITYKRIIAAGAYWFALYLVFYIFNKLVFGGLSSLVT